MTRAGGGRREAGFTIIELMVVLAVLALAYALVAPSVIALLDRPRLDNSARAVAVSLRETRATAIKTFHDTVFTVAPDRKSWRAGGKTGTVAEGVDLSLERPGWDGGRNAGRAQAIIFFPDGSSTGGRILLNSSGRTRVVAVEWLTGRVSEGPE